MRDIEERVMQRLMSKYEGTATGSPGLRKSSCDSDPAFHYLDEIEEVTPCNLVVTCGSSKVQCAKGLVYPHGNGLVNSVPLLVDHKKVVIDQIVPHFESMELPVKTELMTTLLEARNSFVQWPRNAIVLTPSSKSGCVSHEQSNPIKACDEQLSTQPPTSTKSSSIIDLEEKRKRHSPPMSLPTSTGGRKNTPPKEANVKTKTLIAPKNFKPRNHQFNLLYKRLSNRPDPSQYLHVVANPGLYKANAVDIWISPEDIVGLMRRKWLDINVIAWFQIMLHSVLQTREKDQCAFINPHDITSTKCEQYIDHPSSCMVAAMRLHKDKSFFLAPYWQSHHWTLFVICPSQRTGYILDSLRYENGRTVDDFILKQHVEAAVTKYHTEVGRCDTGTSHPMT